MPINGHGINGAAINGSGGAVDKGVIQRGITWRVVGDFGTVQRNIWWDITEVYTRYGREEVTRDVTWTINPVQTVGLGVTWDIYDPVYFQACDGDNAYVWEVIVILEAKAGDRPNESGDITFMLTGSVAVEAEENAARIASFDREPRPKGPCPDTDTDPEFLDLTTHIGREVTIYYVLKGLDGSTISTTQIFYGYVDEITYDPNTRLTSYTCSDGRQLRLENSTRPVIDSITPGAFYSDQIFDVDSDNLEYAEDRQSTVPYSLDLDALGNWVWTPWAAKLTPDFLFDDCAVIHDSLGITIANYREVTTQFDIEFEYGFDRLRQRLANWGWSYPGDFCEYLDSGHTLPQKQTIVSAMNSGSWKLSSVLFENMPPSQLVDCGIEGVRAWVNTGTMHAPLFCLAASGTVYRKWRQGVNEQYQIRVLAPQTASQFGTVIDNASFSVSSDYDSNEWEKEGGAVTEAQIERDPNVGFTAQNLNDGTGLTLGQAEFGEYPYVDLGTGLTDRYFDANTPDLIDEGEGRRSEMQEAIVVAIQIGKTSLLSAHRENSVTWQTPMLPILRLDHTAEIDVCPIHARGKVSAFTHTMDLIAGSAITDMTITLSKALGAPVAETPTSVPPQPDTISPMLEGSPNINLDSKYGGQLSGSPFTFSYPGSTSPPYDEDPFNGYVGNRSPADAGSELYPISFQMVTEEVEEADRDDIEATTVVDYNVSIPNDLLELQA